jgi:hypothetical protein
MGTDFSSFEAHHRNLIAELGVFWVMHMCRGVGNAHFRRLVSRMMTGVNKSVFTYITSEVEDTLMSGAMWTSSQNGMMNLLLMSYLVTRSKYPDLGLDELVEKASSEYCGIHEGDDGLCVTAPVDENLIAQLGLKLKFNYFSDYTLASFCGIICDPVSQTNITNPLKVVRNLFVLPVKYRNQPVARHEALLKAKAMSLLYMYPACPIVSSMCRAIVRRTKRLDVRSISTELDSYKKELFVYAQRADVCNEEIVEISPDTRVLMEEVFQIPAEFQWYAEAAFDNDCFAVDFSMFASMKDFRHVADYVQTPGVLVSPRPFKFIHPNVLRALNGQMVGVVRRCRKKVVREFAALRMPVFDDET